MATPRFLLAAVLLASTLMPTLLIAADTAPDSEIAQRIRARLDAYARRDAAGWASFVSDDCFCAGETKADVVHAIENRPAAVKNWFGDISELRTHDFGDVVTARYRVAEITALDGKRTTIDEWRVETHLRRDGVWQVIAAADNPIAPDPKPVAVPRRVLARYVGTYEYTPGSVDVVTLEGERLFVQSSGEPKVELFAENETTFFAKGQPWRLVFSLDAHKRASSVTFRQLSQAYVGKRLP